MPFSHKTVGPEPAIFSTKSKRQENCFCLLKRILTGKPLMRLFQGLKLTNSHCEHIQFVKRRFLLQ